MRILRLALAATLASAVAATAPAGAATTIGSTCNSFQGGSPLMIQTGINPGTTSYTVPFDGVLTSWRTDRTATPSEGLVSAILATGGGSNWVIAAATPYEFVPGSAPAGFAARVSVRAGQQLGSSTYNSPALMCGTSATADLLEGGPVKPVGSPFTTSTSSADRVNIEATIERDADGDGYGDETQDGCPQSASFQKACPLLTLGQRSTSSPRRISVQVTASSDTSVTATATITLASKTTAKVKSKATAISAGSFKTIKLSLPSSVRSALKRKKLKATVTVSGSGLANTATSSARITLKKL